MWTSHTRTARWLAAALLASALLDGCGGGSDYGTGNAGANAAARYYAYVVNGLPSGTVSTYTIGVLGQLVPGSVFPAGASPTAIAVDPSGRFAYVANSGSSNLSTYAIDGSTGALSAGPTVPTGAGTQPRALAMHPAGTFLYVANGGTNTLTVFSIDSTNGSLTSVGSPIGSGADPSAIAIRPGAGFLYTTNASGNSVSAYAINPGTGLLTSLGPDVTAGTTPQSIVVEASGKYAYVANAGSDEIKAYAINSNTGDISFLGAVAESGGPASLALDRNGAFVYVAAANANTLTAYSIDFTSGLLILLPGTTRPTGTTTPVAMASDPTGMFLYVVSTVSANVLQLGVIAGGGGTFFSIGAPPTAATGANPVAITTVRR